MYRPSFYFYRSAFERDTEVISNLNQSSALNQIEKDTDRMNRSSDSLEKLMLFERIEKTYKNNFDKRCVTAT